jgi:hypothetical protein
VSPEQPVEVPDQAVAVGLELVEIDVLLGVRVHRPAEQADGAGQVLGQALGAGLTQVYGDFRQRQHLAGAVYRAADHHRIPKARLVLDPVEMDAQRRGHLRRQDAVFDHRHHRASDEAGDLALGRSRAAFFLL